MSVRTWLPLGPLCATLLAGSGVAKAAEEPVTLDEEFLEFLGSLDSDDEAWGALLAAAHERDTMKSEAAEKTTSKQEKLTPEQVDP
jgi:hypothetical protein